MLTSDLALRVDPTYEEISRRFLENPDEFSQAFAKAWYKLLHRDMGPVGPHLLGPWVPEPQLWQDPVPAVDHELVDDADLADLKAQLLDSGLSVADLVATAWASAATFRRTDKRGGANGARIRLEPQRGWEVNDPEKLERALAALEGVQQRFNEAQSGGKAVSLADLIVLGGTPRSRRRRETPASTSPCRSAPAAPTPPRSRPRSSRSATWSRAPTGSATTCAPARSCSPRRSWSTGPTCWACRLPRRRPSSAACGRWGSPPKGTRHGVLTDRPGQLTNDFFVNLLSPGTRWVTSPSEEHVYEIRDVSTDEVRHTATAVDLVFGSNSQLRALSEVYASADGEARLVTDFVAAWTKVMETDRFDLSG